ncbi:MAG: M24 family metallopeptidase, partial [Spirochaetia bacterium]
MNFVQQIQEAINGEKLQGWLFFNIFHRDHFADSLLNVHKEKVNTRPWFCIVPCEGEPVTIVHAIESGILDHLQAKKLVYSNREQLLFFLKQYSQENIAANFAETLPDISFLDHGTARVLMDAGFSLVSSQNLLQRITGLLDAEAMKSHELASAHLYEIVGIVWDTLRERMLGDVPVYEGELQQQVLDEFNTRNMITDHPPIIAAGKRTGDPHYLCEGRGKLIKTGDVFQIDLWAKMAEPGSIFADISWVGVADTSYTEEQQQAFSCVVGARDLAVKTITERLAKAEK